MKLLQKVWVEIAASELAFAAANLGLLVAAIGTDSGDEPTAVDGDSVLLIAASPQKKEFSSRMPPIQQLFCRP